MNQVIGSRNLVGLDHPDGGCRGLGTMVVTFAFLENENQMRAETLRGKYGRDQETPIAKEHRHFRRATPWLVFFVSALLIGVMAIYLLPHFW